MSNSLSISRRAMLRGGVAAALPLLGACSGQSAPDPRAAAASDWPQFRGPERSGVSKETGFPLEWNSTKNILWKRDMPGPGTSSPIVFGDRVYVTSYSGYGLDQKAPGNLADL